MRVTRTRDIGIKLPGNISFSFDGADVLFAGGLVCLILGALIKDARFLYWIGGALLAIWLLLTVLLSLGVIQPRKPQPRQGGGVAAPALPQSPPPE